MFVSKIKTQFCNECIHADFHHDGRLRKCNKGHKPKFYLPQDYLDDNYGYKRKCEDFEPTAKPEKG